MSPELKFSFGRGMNTSTNVYTLPADPEELDRLTLQHRIWKLMHGGVGLYPQEVAKQVEDALSEKNGKQPVVLDIGTGSGIWALEMAERFPNAQVVGLDISGNAPTPRPANCNFVKEDITKTIPQYVAQLDVIHIRSVLAHVMESERVLGDIASYLRPGGILLLLDGHSWKDENMTLLRPAQQNVPEPGRSWFARWMKEVRSNSPLKDSPLLNDEDAVQLDFMPMMEGSPSFCNITVKDSFAPIGWSGHDIENGERIGAMMRENSQLFLEASKPSLLRGGVPKETVETWAANLLAEIETAKVYMQWRSICAFKT